LSTGKKKIKIELEDDDGGKYNLSLEGNLSKDKIQKVLQLVESLNISKEDSIALDAKPSYNPNNYNENNTPKYTNKIDPSLSSIESRIWALIEKNFAFSSFTSSNVTDSYEILYGEKLQLSLISTYLSRYFEKNKLMRSKRGKEWIYKLIRVTKDVTVNPQDAQFQTQPTHQLNSHYSSDKQNDDSFLKQNILSTVYDLRL
jgi:predicted transcriptional regulator